MNQNKSRGKKWVVFVSVLLLEAHKLQVEPIQLFDMAFQDSPPHHPHFFQIFISSDNMSMRNMTGGGREGKSITYFVRGDDLHDDDDDDDEPMMMMMNQ